MKLPSMGCFSDKCDTTDAHLKPGETKRHDGGGKGGSLVITEVVWPGTFTQPDHGDSGLVGHSLSLSFPNHMMRYSASFESTPMFNHPLMYGVSTD